MRVPKNTGIEDMTLQSETETPLPVLDLDELERKVERLHAEYQAASPYPHIVIDDFLRPEAVKAAMAEFPPFDPERWNNYLHVNERKFSNTEPETWGPTLQRILEVLNSPRFVQFVGQLLEVEDLVPDPSLEGGGLHQSSKGGFLNIHADFTVHPHKRNWQRRANIILFLNEDWKPEYGGDLELWSTDMKACAEKISPVANRAVIFTTDATSFHGHPDPTRCPEDVARRSLALYYFSAEVDPVVRSTEYRARPGDGAHAILILADKHMLRAYDRMKRHLGISDQLASKLLGYRDRMRRRSPRN
jgi:Rps23 Pro-64 3,4-dihydroxylase Tpa1-like proline 4-hydroxylase